jgi:hypothetical protein
VGNFNTETKELNYFGRCNIKVFDLASMFAGKINAALTRERTNNKTGKKELVDTGRDWYDLVWYLDKGTIPNYDFLSAKLNSMGPYKGRNIKAYSGWVEKELLKRTNSLNMDLVNLQVKSLLKDDDYTILNRDFLARKIRTLKSDGRESYGIQFSDCIKIDNARNMTFDKLCQNSNIKLLDNYGEIKSTDGQITNLKKFRYADDENKKIFVLQRTRGKRDNYECNIFHIEQDFNKSAAEAFLKQYDESTH